MDTAPKFKRRCASRPVPHNIRTFTLLSPSTPLQRGRICGVAGPDRVALDGLEKEDDRLHVPYLRLPRQSATANGATTPGFSGPFPSHSGVFGPPAPFRSLQSTLVREYSVWWQFRPRSLWDASPGVMSQPPVVTWSVFGSPPLRTFHHCPVAGRPLTHSPRREVVSGPVQLGGPTPRLLGDLLWQLGLCLFGLPAREVRVNPHSMIGSWVVALR